MLYQALLRTIREWPKSIYDIPAVIVAIQSELERTPMSSSLKTSSSDAILLMECLAELSGISSFGFVRLFTIYCRYTANRQPGKALLYFLRLRRPNVFELIRENNLFTDVQDQVLLLVEFDQELNEKRKEEGVNTAENPSEAISMLVDHTHSIPVMSITRA